MKAYEAINGPTKFIKYALTRTKDGKGVNSKGEYLTYEDPEAFKFCAVGALAKVYGAEYMKPLLRVERVLKEREMGTHLSIWNNRPERTWEDVHNLFKEFDI